MALSLSICVTQNGACDTITVKDTSGVYASDNTGGYGSPNPTIGSATAATITISKLEDAATNTYSEPVEIDAYDTLPNITNTGFEITAEDAGYGTDSIFPDGYYKIIYTVEGDSGGAYTATVTEYATLKCQIECCWKNLADEVSTCSCDCVDVKEKFARVSLFKRLLESAIDCGEINDIERYIEYLTNNCEDCNCC